MNPNSRMQRFLSRFRRKPAPDPDPVDDTVAVPENAEIGWKEKTLMDFKAWLDELPDEGFSPGQEGLSGSRPDDAEMDACDLYTLLTEFIALRQEIKLQNREQNNAIRIHEALIDRSKESIALFKERSQSLETLEERIRAGAEIRTLERFFDIRDALLRGKAAARAALDKGLFFRPSSRRRIEGVAEGYEMALRRFDRVLLKFGVTPVLSVGQSFDPALMRAVGSRRDPEKEKNIVIEEHLGGFVKGADVLRVAEVIVSTGPEVKK